MWNRIYFSNQELSWQFRPWIISLKQLQLVPWLNNKQIQVTYSTHFTLTPTISHLLHPFHTYSTHFTLTPPISHLLHPFHTYSTHFSSHTKIASARFSDQSVWRVGDQSFWRVSDLVQRYAFPFADFYCNQSFLLFAIMLFHFHSQIFEKHILIVRLWSLFSMTCPIWINKPGMIFFILLC